MKYALLLFITIPLLSTSSYSQLTDYDDVKLSLETTIQEVNTARSEIVTGRGFNSFLQRKVSGYLTGSSEISLFKTFATYTAENDKLTFGINFKKENEETGRLVSLFTPLLEAGVKNNFATLYKKDEWQGDIRLGFKYSLLFGSSTINFFGFGQEKGQQDKMVKVRNLFLKKKIKALDDE
jgi:hypothetical protein